MFRSYFRSAIFFAGFLMIVFALSLPARAITISPAMIDLEIEPGYSQDGVLTIQNTSQAALTYFVSAQNFVSKGEEGQQEFITGDQPTDLAAWIKPELESITLKPNETQVLRYNVHVPAEAVPGGHYAALFFSTQPAIGSGETSIGIGAKTGVLFLVRVPGKIIELAAVENFLTPNGLYSSLPAHFILRIKNLGNVHLRPQGQIIIKNIFGQPVESVPLNPKEAAVLPNGIRRLETSWVKSSFPPEQNFLADVKNEWVNFAFGRYTADLNANYGRANLPLSARLIFWVVPWRLCLLTFAGLVLLMLAVKGYNRMVVMRALGRRIKQTK